MFRETGLALDRASYQWAKSNLPQETCIFFINLITFLVSRNRPLMNIVSQKPKATKDCFVAPTACVIGDVILNEQSSVWYNTVIRGDHDKVIIGKCSNVQEGCVITTEERNISQPHTSVNIGNHVTIGHGATLHCCEVGDTSLIGMGAVLYEGVKVGCGSLVGAGSVVKAGTVIPDGELWAGNPAVFKRKLTPEEIKGQLKQATDYHICADNHKAEFKDKEEYYDGFI